MTIKQNFEGGAAAFITELTQQAALVNFVVFKHFEHLKILKENNISLAS